MFILNSLSGSTAFYIFENNRYLVGRKACDFLITGDTSISKNHAVISYTSDSLEIEDVGAKYNTFLNGVKLEINKKVGLKDGDTLRFGILKSVFKVLELSNIFLLVWYYCTLTIRESILKVNGSKIKGWWRLHHFISTAAAAILLIWPDQVTWSEFRNQFIWFNVYLSVVQYLQFRYQIDQLYRLKALGERHTMDITIEGFHSWMSRGLSFLIPFLYAGYLFQLYNAYVLYHLSFYPTATWHIRVLSLMFFVLFVGNTTTTSLVIPSKFKEKVMLRYKVMSQVILKRRKFLEKEEDEPKKNE